MVDWKGTVMEGRVQEQEPAEAAGLLPVRPGQVTASARPFQDYTFTELALFTREDPIPRIMPILENEHEEKRLMVVSTPRGKRKNPLWQLMQSLSGNPEAQVIVRTIDDLNEIMRRDGLPPVRSPSSSSSRSAIPTSSASATTGCSSRSTTARSRRWTPLPSTARRT
jgi:hypothetical protein